MDKYTKEIAKQSEAYKILFDIENKLRVGMHNLMIEKEGICYFSKNIFPPFEYGKRNLSIIDSVLSRKSKEKDLNLKLKYEYPHFWYLDYKILIATIEHFWGMYFNSLFNINEQCKDDVICRLLFVAPIRNAIAHNRYISHIDLNDIKSLHAILEASIEKKYLYNFNDVALNSFEIIIDDLIDICKNIREKISTKIIINSDKLRNLKSIYSIYNSIIEKQDDLSIINQVIRQIDTYNNLPRKPGNAKKINDFVKDTELLNKLDSLIERIEGKNVN